ncbi:hypothetical protein SH661x_003506 [Planctomicrobium sp. SH661]|uniref:hypothetical protein n=1 Tax=Planctomicrobium sp. SH661 TaxID=3448124 RepID=UPI003F5B65A6
MLSGKAVAAENEPVPDAASVAVPNLNGEWSGSWTSCGTGHKGPLRATFCQVDACHYEVRFKGRFCKVIPFHYKTILTVTATEDGRVWLRGSERLGLLLGTFSMNGWATSNQFVSSYTSKDDQGQFSLRRCQP